MLGRVRGGAGQAGKGYVSVVLLLFRSEAGSGDAGPTWERSCWEDAVGLRMPREGALSPVPSASQRSPSRVAGTDASALRTSCTQPGLARGAQRGRPLQSGTLLGLVFLLGSHTPDRSLAGDEFLWTAQCPPVGSPGAHR